MSSMICDGAKLECSYGQGEVKLSVSRRGVSHGGDRSLATIDDHLPLVNVPPFRFCTAPANPNPQSPSGQKPCTPRLSSAWSDEVEGILLQGQKLVEESATLRCDYAGTISVAHPGQKDATLHENTLKRNRYDRYRAT